MPDKILFDLGTIVVSPHAKKAHEESCQCAYRWLMLHIVGDHGDVPMLVKMENVKALRLGLRIRSLYKTANGERIAVITEQGRSTTRIMLFTEWEQFFKESEKRI